MRKTCEFTLGMTDGDGDPDEDRTRLVHVVSRSTGRKILFGEDEKNPVRAVLAEAPEGLPLVPLSPLRSGSPD